LLTSRPYDHIRRQIHQHLNFEMASIHLQGSQGETSDDIANEIKLVVNSRISQIITCHDLDEKESELLRDRLGSIPNRTYLWATLVFDGLLEDQVGLTKAKILAQLTNPPASVYDAYERILRRDADQAEPRRRALHIILGAKRPLLLNELSVAVAFGSEEDSIEIVENSIVPLRRADRYIRDLCGLFVTIVDGRVYLLHQTTREFLIGARPIGAQSLPALGQWKSSMYLGDSNSILAHTCIRYLCWAVAGIDRSLWDYAVTHWVAHYHESVAEKQEQLAELTRDLCSRIGSEGWISVYSIMDRTAGPETPLVLASALGLPGAVRLLLDTETADVNATDRMGRTPLSWAAKGGHEAVVKLLLDTGKVDADAKSLRGQTPLWQAVEGGHEAVVKLLLDTGKVNADTKDRVGRTPLWQAVEGGHEAVVKLLLDTGKVDADANDGIGRTPLWIATYVGHEAVVKLLLGIGKADADVKDYKGRTPLWIAAHQGHEAVVKLLLDTGKVDADAKDVEGRTPLQIATQGGHEAVVKLLQTSC
jgi:ankyrin repeat protein